MEYDVVIVGGGPAGCSIGTLLFENNVSVCIIDKSLFPREKLCGGLITEKTFNLMNEIFPGIDISESQKACTRNINLYYKGDMISQIATSFDFRIVNRAEFDKTLIDYFKKNGGYLYERIGEYNIDYLHNCVHIPRIGDINYKFLVGADGVYSNVRKYVDSTYKANGLCIEGMIDGSLLQIDNQSLHIHFGNIRGGYGWVFPKDNRFVVGFGSDTDIIKENMPRRFEEYCFSLGIIADQTDYKGMYVPYGKYVNIPIKDNVLLVGDAAGLVEPITGEGIYYAMLSAKYAANHIRGKLSHPNSDPLYLRSIQNIHKQITSINKTKKLFFNWIIQKYGFKMAKGHKRFASMICNEVIATGNMNYHQATVGYLKARFFKRR